MVSLSNGKEVQKLVVAPTLLNASLHSLFIFSAIFFEELSSHAVGRRVGIWVTKQRLDRGKDRRHVVGRAPPIIMQGGGCSHRITSSIVYASLIHYRPNTKLSVY